MGEQKFDLCKLPQIQIIKSNLKDNANHSRNTLSPQPKTRLFLWVENEITKNMLNNENQELLEWNQIYSKDKNNWNNIGINSDLLARLMSRYTQKRSPFQEFKDSIFYKHKQTHEFSILNECKINEEYDRKYISIFHPKSKDFSIRAKHHPRIRKLNQREKEIRAKILSTIMSEGDLKSIK